jgi:hypothetical protein
MRLRGPIRPPGGDLLLLAGLSLAINGVVAALVKSPAQIDAYYHFNGGWRLAEGYGLSDPYLWNYVSAPALPTPSHTYWQPLASLMAWLGIALFGGWVGPRDGPPFEAAQIPFVLLAAALPLIGYAIGRRVGGTRRHGLLAGLLIVFSGFYVPFWSLTEVFTPYGVAGALSLWLMGVGRERGRPIWWALAGACAGLAHLARADGLLLMGVLILVALWPDVGLKPDATHGHLERHRSVGLQANGLREVGSKPFAYAGAGVLGYGLVMAPWFARNLAAFGRLMPTGGAATLWLVEYNDMFNYPPNLSMGRYLASGLRSILAIKARALLANLATLAVVMNMVFLVPFTLIGLWRRWREAWLLPATLYALALFAAMTFAFTLPGVRGGLFHSGAALLPFFFAAALVGLDGALAWLTKRAPTWQAARAARVFGWAFVGFAALISVWVVLTRVVGMGDLRTVAWNHGDDVYERLVSFIDGAGDGCEVRVMSNDPPGVYYHTGCGGVPLPNGNEATLVQAAADYCACYLVLDRNVPDGLIGLYLDGPATDRLKLIHTFGDGDPMYLYAIRVEEARCGCDW